jgi:hypothetical protein
MRRVRQPILRIAQTSKRRSRRSNHPLGRARALHFGVALLQATTRIRRALQLCSSADEESLLLMNFG